ncbi:UNVERIFIED_CONTAM: hypothetical protein Sangu_2714900 [Sesamum angustifolium]|uniref:Uncharacterized protein n=1 Tax=Sesamum angustifolium TaxID=2727405 RepID=A0AAW2IXA7_9LAMI
MEFWRITMLGVLSSEALVPELMDGDTGLWQEELVQETWAYGAMAGGAGSRGFSPDDALTILASVLGGLLNIDVLIWHFTQDGVFSIKSSYQLKIQRQRMVMESI